MGESRRSLDKVIGPPGDFMPIQLTSKEYNVIGVCAVVAAISLAIGVKYFWKAFPEAAIDFRVTREQSVPLAEKFLADSGFRLSDYRHASIFDYSEETKVYLERTQGLERMNVLTRGPVRLWRWSHRWFRPQQKEEFRVDVTPSGEVVRFDHDIEETASGANLSPEKARAIADRFLREVMKRDLSDLEFVETETEKRPARTDHAFIWKQKSVDLGEGSMRIEVEVDGDRVAGYREFVKIPEPWMRDYERLRSRNNSAQLVAEFFFVLLSVAMLVVLILRLRDRDVPTRVAAKFSLVAAALYFLGELNDFSVAEFAYRTADSYSSFVAGYIQRNLLSSLAVGAGIFFLVASAEPVYRESFPKLVSVRRYLSWRGLRTRSFFMANIVGIALTFFFFAYQTVFYLAANKLGAWAPADVNYSDLLNTRIPWVWVLFGGFLPAVSEEMQFRAFAIPFLKKALRSGAAALVLAAFTWGFLHSAYPNQPFFIRGIEVGMGGIFIGLVMMRFGILATLIWHYSVDALYTAFLLVRSHNRYFVVSGAVTAGIMLVPLIAALVAYWRSGTFLGEEALTNRSEGISRAERKEPAVVEQIPLTYRSLDSRRLVMAGILTLIFVGLALIPVHRIGEGIKLVTSRREALRLADDFLAGRKVATAVYRRAAWLRLNVDPSALKYMLERRSVEECDRITRLATRLLLWEVRYFRPLQKEEHHVFIDAAAGQVFAYRHLLDEDAAGASLTLDQARVLAAKAVEDQGYRLAGFEAAESQAEKRKARRDFRFVWQAKPGDPRNVGEARYRLEVEVAGDQVVGVARYFKLPEEWLRRRGATPLADQALKVVFGLAILGVSFLCIHTLVNQIRSGKIPWRAAGKIGATVAIMLMFLELDQLPTLYRNYNTEVSWKTFWLSGVLSILVVPLVLGLLCWLVVALAAGLYPDALQVFRKSSRRVWRRDAAVAAGVSLASAAAMNKLAALVLDRFHAFSPVRFSFVPELLDSFSPGGGFFLQALVYSAYMTAVAGILIYIVRLGWSHWRTWAVLGGLLFLVSLGPKDAQSIPEYFVGWATRLVAMAIAIGVVAAFFRDNALAYVSSAFCLLLADPLVSLLSQPATFFRWNGVLLLILALVVLGWMFAGGDEATVVGPPEAVGVRR